MDNLLMAIPRIYCPEALRAGTQVVLTGNAANHLTRVLRLKPGDAVCLFHDSGHEYMARIDKSVQSGLRLSIQESHPVHTESTLHLTLIQGICRGQKMDLVIQKATELGVSAILPLRCQRSVVRLQGDRAARRREHWFGVATGAAEQCGRAVVPRIFPAMHLAEALVELPAAARRLLLDPGATAGFGHERPAENELVLLAGPEGGLTDNERDTALKAGFTGVRLGPRVLRTETAPLAALSVVQYLYGDLAG